MMVCWLFLVHFFLEFNVLKSFSTFSDYDVTVPRVELPLVDPIREDDHESFELYNIITMAVATIDHPIDALTREHKQYVVDIHNNYKNNLTGYFPPGSDMEMAEYNNTLEWTAYEYAKLCNFGHAFADIDNMTAIQGQNLYQGRSKLLGWPMHMFYMEYIWFYFNNLTCWTPYPKYKCGHVTQMMWHNTSHLGVARRSYCWPEAALTYVLVHYLEGGNYYFTGFQVYKIGWRCTNCPPGYLCAMNMCVPERYCGAYNLDCECIRVCKNCGKPDFKRCMCHCKKGWDWDDCSFPCINLFDTNYAKYRRICKRRSRSRKHCRDITWRMNCRVWCYDCEPAKKDHDPNQLCCSGKTCEPYFALDEKTCECKLLCPSLLCMHPPSTEKPTTTTTTTTTTNKPNEGWFGSRSAATFNLSSLMVVFISWIGSTLI